MNLFENCFRNSLTGVESGYLIYIAGPISGDVLGNLPDFFAAEDSLRAAGHSTFNPARCDGGRTEAECIEFAIERLGNKSWAQYMKQGLAGLARCNSIVTVGEWWTSRGAYLEHHIASQLGYAKFNRDGTLAYEPNPRPDSLSFLG